VVWRYLEDQTLGAEKLELVGTINPANTESSREVGEDVRRNYISRAELRELSRQSNLPSAKILAIDFSVVAIAVIVSEMFWNPLLFVCAVAIITTRQLSFGTLIHDAVHFTMFKSNKANEIFGEFLAWIHCMSLEAVRKHHNAHHRHINSEMDPDKTPLKLPDSTLKTLWFFGRIPTGIMLLTLPFFFIKYLKTTIPDNRPRSRMRLAFYSAFLVMFAVWPVMLKIYFMYWLLPMFTFTSLAAIIRGMSEHRAMEPNHDANQARTVIPSFLDRLFIAPNNVSYHQGHHLHASVPWYNQERLHQILRQNKEFADHAHDTQGYRAFFGELIEAGKKARGA